VDGVIGTTALMALLRRNKLVVANVGDSRGVLCDQHGNAVPLSSDHKPHNVSHSDMIMLILLEFVTDRSFHSAYRLM